ncbi:hypothetical protein QQ020_26840 [Fulvivirgaceae bacterium BMA12]|uniref:Transglutaminase-like domain-containing protein n=1 Tax=Agaribacillus aureus TaxID=3051825 RepID=A0ABT8LD70_9BACT|nr:hypothetical protein [Fulvivirgaceae bacterium BMA12]
MKPVVTILFISLLFNSLIVVGQFSSKMDYLENRVDIQPASTVSKAITDHGNSHLNLFLDGKGETDQSNVIASIDGFNAFIKKLDAKRNRIKSDHRFFNYLFYRTHRKYLKHYEAHTSVEDILHSGKYDCVSGTAFFTLILDRLGIDYEIKEFDFHVLVIAYTNNERFLIESTDPTGGLVYDERSINDRIKQYITSEEETRNILRIGAKENLYQHSFSINNSITLTELAGLQHFNNAIYYYNQRKPFETVLSLKKSLALYDSKRIRKFQRLAATSFLGDANLTHIQKEQLINEMGFEFTARQ